jgi:hypothetical protein
LLPLAFSHCRLRSGCSSFITCSCRLLLRFYISVPNFGLVLVSLLLSVLVSNLRSIPFCVNLLLLSVVLSSCLSLFFSCCLSMSFKSVSVLILLPVPVLLLPVPILYFLNCPLPPAIPALPVLVFYILPVLGLVLPVFPLNLRPGPVTLGIVLIMYLWPSLPLPLSRPVFL